jgi:hypothetical protein
MDAILIVDSLRKEPGAASHVKAGVVRDRPELLS